MILSDRIPETKEESPAHFHRGPSLCSHVPMAMGSVVEQTHGGRKVMSAWRYTEVETDVMGARGGGS